MKLKIGIAGPPGSGKTFVSNILANEQVTDTSGVKPPYRPTHSVRIVEFTLNNLELKKYNLDVDVQLWEVGGNPALKSIYPGMQANLDGVIIMYDVSKEQHIREASTFHMNFVTHSPSGLSPAQCLLIGNKFRGSAEHGPQKIIGVPPRIHHIALNIEDDPHRLREEVKILVARVAQITIDQEKANLITNDPDVKYIPMKLTPSEFRLLQDDTCAMDDYERAKSRKGAMSRKSRSRALIGDQEQAHNLGIFNE